MATGMKASGLKTQREIDEPLRGAGREILRSRFRCGEGVKSSLSSTQPSPSRAAGRFERLAVAPEEVGRDGGGVVGGTARDGALPVDAGFLLVDATLDDGSGAAATRE